MTTELITQLIILATAIVGLYKAATFHRTKPERENEGGEKQKKTGLFSDLFDLIGILLFMLAFPAFIYAFMWIMSSLPHSISSSSSTEDFPKIEISKESTTGEVMLAAALNITNSQARNEQLQGIITYAMSNNDYQTALRAASAISSSYTKNEELEKIIKELASRKEVGVKENLPNNKIQPTPKSGASD
jgi:flagellar basal body-associated protein FliL